MADEDYSPVEEITSPDLDLLIDDENVAPTDMPVMRISFGGISSEPDLSDAISNFNSTCSTSLSDMLQMDTFKALPSNMIIPSSTSSDLIKPTSLSPETETIQVCLRIRPLTKAEFEANPVKTITVTSENSIEMKAPLTSHAFKSGDEGGSFTFSKVFDDNVDQAEFYDKSFSSVVEKAIEEGQHGALFAYGMTGSGKTFTVSGTPAAPGVLTRTLKTLFDRLGDKVGKIDSEFMISLTYVEIYNEAIYDLFTSNGNTKAQNRNNGVRKQLELLKNREGQVFVSKVSQMTVSSMSSAIAVLRKGAMNKTHAETAMNADSSRSHTVLQINIWKRNEEALNYIREHGFSSTTTSLSSTASIDSDSAIPYEVVNKKGDVEPGYSLWSRLSIVDLAGSERNDRTAVISSALSGPSGLNSTSTNLNSTTGNVGTSREAANINKSLMQLRLCFDKLRERQKTNNKSIFIPTRDSKLTYLFSDFLSGTSTGKMIMVVNVGPAAADYDETVPVMRYGSLAMDIKVQKNRIMNGLGNANANKDNEVKYGLDGKIIRANDREKERDARKRKLEEAIKEKEKERTMKNVRKIKNVKASTVTAIMSEETLESPSKKPRLSNPDEVNTACSCLCQCTGCKAVFAGVIDVKNLPCIDNGSTSCTNPRASASSNFSDSLELTNTLAVSTLSTELLATTPHPNKQLHSLTNDSEMEHKMAEIEKKLLSAQRHREDAEFELEETQKENEELKNEHNDVLSQIENLEFDLEAAIERAATIEEQTRAEMAAETDIQMQDLRKNALLKQKKRETELVNAAKNALGRFARNSAVSESFLLSNLTMDNLKNLAEQAGGVINPGKKRQGPLLERMDLQKFHDVLIPVISNNLRAKALSEQHVEEAMQMHGLKVTITDSMIADCDDISNSINENELTFHEDLHNEGGPSKRVAASVMKSAFKGRRRGTLEGMNGSNEFVIRSIDLNASIHISESGSEDEEDEGDDDIEDEEEEEESEEEEEEEENTNALMTQLMSANNIISSLSAQVSKLTSDLSAKETLIQELNDNVESTSAELKEAREQISSYTETVAELKHSLQAALENASSDSKTTLARATRAEKEVQSLLTIQRGLNAKISAFESSLAESKLEVSNLSTKLAAAENAMAEATGRATAADMRHDTLASSIDGYTARIKELESRINFYSTKTLEAQKRESERSNDVLRLKELLREYGVPSDVVWKALKENSSLEKNPAPLDNNNVVIEHVSVESESDESNEQGGDLNGEEVEVIQVEEQPKKRGRPAKKEAITKPSSSITTDERVEDESTSTSRRPTRAAKANAELLLKQLTSDINGIPDAAVEETGVRRSKRIVKAAQPVEPAHIHENSENPAAKAQKAAMERLASPSRAATPTASRTRTNTPSTHTPAAAFGRSVPAAASASARKPQNVVLVAKSANAEPTPNPKRVSVVSLNTPEAERVIQAPLAAVLPSSRFDGIGTENVGIAGNSAQKVFGRAVSPSVQPRAPRLNKNI